MKVDAAGFVTVVIGPDSIKSMAVGRGQNWLPWGTQSFQVLVYRNLLSNPEFAGDLHKVKKVESGALFQPSQYAAQNFIGEYAPVGRKCIRLAYMANNCGL